MRIGIRTRVIFLALVAALPLIAVDVYEAKQAQREQFRRAEQDALLLARSFAAMLDDVFDDTRYLLAGFNAAFENPHRALTGTTCERRLQRLLDSSPFHINIVIASTSGDLVCAARPLSQPINVADRRYFREAIAHKTFGLSDLIVSRDSGVPVLVAAGPVIEPEGRISAILLATIKMERLSRVFERAGAPDYLVTHLVNSKGTILARWPHVAGFAGQTLDGLAARIRDGNANEGLAELVGADGTRRISAYARLRDIAGDVRYIVSGIPIHELERAPRKMLERDLLVLAVTLATALGLGLLSAHLLVVKPVRRLTTAAERYGRGDLSARSGLAHGMDEIGKLASTFDVLAEQNQRVTRALRALSAGNRTVLREKQEGALLEAMCRVTVEHAGYRLAFVNYAQQDERKSVRTVAQAGHDEGFVESLDLTWADTERGRGTVGTTIRNGATTIIHSMPRDRRFVPWRESAIAHGFRSIASFALRVDNAVIGTFTLIAAEENAFGGAELELLEEMAADLAFGIEVIRSNARRLAAEDEARRAVTHDPLTGLPGRIVFLRMLQETARGIGDRKESLAVIVVNLANLQDLHDSLGYEALNAAVAEASARLSFAMAPATALARLSADDFALLLRADTPVLEALMRRLHALIETPVDVKDVSVSLRVALGASLYPANGQDADTLTRRATIAAREAARREQPFYLYSASERENPERLALAAELRVAIDQRALLLHFQPKLDMKSNRIVACEALIRWPHPVRGMIPPGMFVPIAEQSGQIRDLTYFVLDAAAHQQRQWSDAGRAIPIAVNLSVRNLYDPRLIERIDRALAECNLPASSLELEITESALMEEPAVAKAAVTALRDRGFKIYIDDFGTGYSSLAYLVSLPVHALKIDRAFVVQMTKSAQAHSVVASVIAMAHGLGLRVVAEGVETAEEMGQLSELGCDEIQGYYIGRPVPADKFGN
jgi:diguanylate cyclase (GGDEF)-like protein